MFRLDGKVALVTGGSRGIGRAISEALAEQGAAVIVNYVRGEAQAKEVADGIVAKGGKAEILGFDVADPKACEEAVTAAAKRAGRLDIVVSNAGRVVFISSVVGESGNAGQTAYSASKAALIGLTKSLAREYVTRGITVNAVAPGYVDTDMTQALTPEQREALLAAVPMGRVATARDVAAAVAYLASDEASYVTGQVLRVNGGMYM